MAKALTKEYCILKSIETHGSKFDYSDVVFVDMNTKVVIICNSHICCFKQTFSSHIYNKSGCPVCRNEANGIRSKREIYDTEIFDKEKWDIYNKSQEILKIQKAIMADGYVKEFKDIKIGDSVLGPDSTPRVVLDVKCNFGKIFEVILIHGKIKESFICSENSIITLNRNNNMFAPYKPKELRNRPNKTGFTRNRKSINKIILENKLLILDLSISDCLLLSNNKKRSFSIKKSEKVSFLNEMNNLPIDPYILGLLIGDGSLMTMIQLTTADFEIENCFREFVESNGLFCNKKPISSKTEKINKACTFSASTRKNKNDKFMINPLMDKIRKLGLNKRCDYKFIPNIYKTSSIENRLQILAGLIDTDGHYDSFTKHFEFCSKSKMLAEDVVFLARSVGLYASIRPKKSSAYLGHSNVYYYVYINGELNIIPTKIERKKAIAHIQNRDNSLSRFIINQIEDSYIYDLLVDGDHRYLLDGFIITHDISKVNKETNG